MINNKNVMMVEVVVCDESAGNVIRCQIQYCGAYVYGVQFTLAL